MAEAIRELAEIDNNQYLQPAGEHQDPFVVLQLIMKTLEAMRKDQRTKPLYPIWGCDCGREDAILMEGCLDYERIGAQRFSLAKPYCSACGGTG
jgi:hypothetical protein